MSYNQNSYTLRTEEIGACTHYYVLFIDSQNIKRELEVNFEIYSTLEESLREEANLARKERKYAEQSKLSDTALHKRTINKVLPVDEFVLKKIFLERVLKAIEALPAVQKRRLTLYYQGLTYQQIAKQEDCTQQAVAKSVKVGKMVLEKLLEEEG